MQGSLTSHSSFPASLVSAQWLSDEPNLVIRLLCPAWGRLLSLGLPTVQLHPQGFVVATRILFPGLLCPSITSLRLWLGGLSCQTLSGISSAAQDRKHRTQEHRPEPGHGRTVTPGVGGGVGC